MLPLYRTLGQLRTTLQTRLGFGMSGQAGIINSPIIDSFLQSAQTQLYEQTDWRHLCDVQERLTGVDQRWYDYPADCNIERVRSVSIWTGATWRELEEGISLVDRSLTHHLWPIKFERFAQIELWPVPQSQLQMRIDYVKVLAPFTASNDRSSLPDEMVFILALVNARTHYRMPQVERDEKQLDALLAKLKAGHRGKSVWTREAVTYDTVKDRLYSGVVAVDEVLVGAMAPSPPAPSPTPTPSPPPPPPPPGGAALQFNVASNSQYVPLAF